ncbi:filamin-C-like isoform X2 [Daphnia pulicaria]|uniref:filamin-C-like isoform X2 n=1 Tax=Daphnia pulicaria TaxID=35523 RepID=UPI001EEC7CEC|nr:filamin-C-like isoform X2 [Daphnia pulicaria]
MEDESAYISHSGLVARSPQGHAATSMPIKGNEEIWVEIQTHTFRNWVNDMLKETGFQVRDLSTDLCDGVRLVALIEVLQKRKLRNVLRPVNQHQMLENATTALNAITADGIKLVNIGNVDIVNGNLKLILGLIWSLIVHYQIGRSKFPPKKLMLAWLKAVLPETGVHNFTTDWNSGIRLAALLDYCKPGLFPNWRELDPRNSVENCRRAMELAQKVFDIPMVLEPEYLASPYLDDLSGMTYLSYFMKENSPGFFATLRWVNSQIPQMKINNFTSNWNDGVAVCSLVHSLGGPVPGFNNLSRDPENWESNLELGIHGGERLNVEPVLKAVDMADPNVEHLGVMAYAAYFQWVKARPKPCDRLKIIPDGKTVRVHNPANFKIEYLVPDVDIKEITAEVRGPSGEVECRLNLTPTGGSGSFIPTEVGMHELTVYCEGEVVTGCPVRIRALPDLSQIMFSGIDPCALGSIVEVLINSNGAGGGSLEVEAKSPTDRILNCPVSNDNGVYTATFQPDEAGEWKISVTYEGEHIQGSPFTCFVFDPHAVKLLDITGAIPGEKFTFTCDASEAGWGEAKFDLVHRGRSLPHTVREVEKGIYMITFTPQERGKHRVYVYYNGIEVKGSPFSLRVGSGSSGSADKHNHTRDSKYGASNTASFNKTKDTTTDISAENVTNRSVNTNVSSLVDKGYSTLTSDRRHLTELNQEKLYASLGRDKRLSSVERENKLLSPEKVLSLRRNSAGTGADAVTHPTQPLSSLFQSSNAEEVNGRSTSKMSREFTTNESRRYVNETFESRSSNHLSSVNKHEYNSNEISSPINHVLTNKSESNRIDSASNVKVSSMALGATPYRRDSWDAMAKTGIGFSPDDKLNSSSLARNLFVDSVHDESDAVHSRLTSIRQFDVANVTVTGEGLNLAPVGRVTTFTIQSRDMEANDVNVKITGPNQRNIPVQIQKAPGGVNVSFSSTSVGEYTIDVQVKNQRLAGAPFRCFAYNAEEIRVGRVPSGVVGKPVEFEIDGSTAGSGNLEILVNGGHVTSYVRELGDQCFLASFVPHQSTVHTIEMKFNGETVRGSPWEVEVSEGSTTMLSNAAIKPAVIGGEGVRHFAAGKIASFDLDLHGKSRDAAAVSITSPSKRQLSSRLVDGPTSQVHRVEFNPSEVGSYLIDISVDGLKIQGSPFVAKAYDSSLIRVTDVTNGAVGQPCQFRVDASQAGEGQLEISINDGEVPNHVQVLGGGKCLVSFTPEIAKIHTIEIKFNGETVPGCPFVCKIADTSRVSVSLRNMELVAAGEVAQFEITVDGTANSELAVAVKGPTTNLPVKISGGARNTFTAEFSPREVGSHTISVDYNGLPVTGTPFVCKVYDSKKVYVSPMPTGVLRKNLQFTVDASQAGEGNLEITISARGRNIPTKVHPQGSARFAVSFVPLEAIDHVITITFNKEAVPGSPFNAPVFTEPDRIVVSGQSLASSAVGKTSYFKLSNVTGSVEDIEINVEGPSLGNTVAAQVKDNGDQTFQAEFTPKVAGEHRIHVLYEGQPVAGSPFSCKVYDVTAIKVKEAAKGVVGKPVTFLVETSQAGPGNLEVTVNGGQVPTSAQAHGLHTYAISFTPKDPKPHEVELKFNGENVPGSPFICQVIDSRQVRVTGDGLEKTSVNRPASFLIDIQGQPSTLDVRVLSPSRRVVPSAIDTVTESRYSVTYTPNEVGDHNIEIKYADLPIHGSPFTVKAYDSAKVRVTDVNNGVVGKFVFFSIDASQAGAGNLEIIVSVNGRHVPNYVQSEGNAKFKVSFKPQEPLPHTLSVRFNGEAVPGSPFTCRVTDANQILVSGAGVKMSPLNKPASLLIDSRGAEMSDCKVSVISTSGQDIPVNLEVIEGGKFKADFLPFEVGPHTVSVMMNGDEPVGGSPFVCNIYDVSKVLVTGLGSAKICQSITFTVDASQAGEGTLELVVTTTKSSVKADVRARSRGLYDVTFIPQEAVPHFVNITFNDEDVPGSPFKCEISDDGETVGMAIRAPQETKQATANGDGLKEVALGAPAFFEIDTNGMDGLVDVKIVGPGGNIISSQITRMKNGFYRVEYEPEVVGTYRVEISHQSKPITEHPFYVEVTDPASVRISEVHEAYAGKESYFILDTSEAGRGTLHVALRAANQSVKHNVQNLGNGLLKVIYFPKLPIPHRVDLRYSGVHASGCPFELKVKNPYLGKEILAHGTGLYQCRTGHINSFIIDTRGSSTKLFDVVVAGPQDMAVPVRCYQQKDGNLLAQFTPPVSGGYRIDVLYDGKPLRGSPFTAQAYDAQKVTVDNVRSANVSVHEPISFQIRKREAGMTAIDVTVVTPTSKELPLEVKSLQNGEGDLVEYHPTLPGKYSFNVICGGEAIPGSPFIFVAEEEGLAKAHGEGLLHGIEGLPSQFTIDARGLVGEPTIQIDGPDSICKCQVLQESIGVFRASYTPQEVGIFDVRVLWNGRDIHGSPFHPRVINPRKVRVIGGWESLTDSKNKLILTLGEEKKISFDTLDAGPGMLLAEIRSPSGLIKTNVETPMPHRTRVGFTPMEVGEYSIKFTWNRVPLPNSPVVGVISIDLPSEENNRTLHNKSRASSISSSSSGGDHKVILTGQGLAKAITDTEAEFTIDGSRAGPGIPEVTMTGIKTDLNVTLTLIGNNMYRASYTPDTVGVYLLNVMWAERQVKGCPLKVTVNSTVDASKVICSGEGLKWGILGREIKSFIDTRNSGPGELAAQCVGPHKVAFCELFDHCDGTYSLLIKPQEHGRHTLNIKYGGQPVNGSPFNLRVMGAPDATKVRVHGPGIEHGVLATFQSRFLCDTRGAGAGQLTVRVRGPKGAFRVEMQRENQKDRSIVCKYDPTEPGDYRIEVRWSGEHVPGSPFNVMIFDTQEELGRFVQGGYSPQQGNNVGSEFYGGSMGYSTGFGQMNLSAVSWRGSQAQL